MDRGSGRPNRPGTSGAKGCERVRDRHRDRAPRGRGHDRDRDSRLRTHGARRAVGGHDPARGSAAAPGNDPCRLRQGQQRRRRPGRRARTAPGLRPCGGRAGRRRPRRRCRSRPRRCPRGRGACRAARRRSGGVARYPARAIPGGRGRRRRVRHGAPPAAACALRLAGRPSRRARPPRVRTGRPERPGRRQRRGRSELPGRRHLRELRAHEVGHGAEAGPSPLRHAAPRGSGLRPRDRRGPARRRDGRGAPRRRRTRCRLVASARDRCPQVPCGIGLRRGRIGGHVRRDGPGLQRRLPHRGGTGRGHGSAVGRVGGRHAVRRDPGASRGRDRSGGAGRLSPARSGGAVRPTPRGADRPGRGARPRDGDPAHGTDLRGRPAHGRRRRRSERVEPHESSARVRSGHRHHAAQWRARAIDRRSRCRHRERPPSLGP